MGSRELQGYTLTCFRVELQSELVVPVTLWYPFLELESSQHAACVAMCPVPLPRPGYFGVTLTEFQSCVPAVACPGVDAAAVEAAMSMQLAGGAGGTPTELESWLDAFVTKSLHNTSNDHAGLTDASNVGDITFTA